MRECLGSGGFGEVYLATEHTGEGSTREVAMKVLHEQLDESSDAVKRLRDEGAVLAMLAHPAILAVHEFTGVDNRLALVTEYVDGTDIAAFCEPDVLLPPRVAVEIALKVAEALDFAWKAPDPNTGKALQLIHRDIKPENIRLSTAGQVKLLDFGVARSNEMKRHARTAYGQVVLTPGYGAPETLMFGVSSPSVDVFALGATLFALLVGEPFYGKLQLGAQVALAADSVEYAEHLEERMARIALPEIRSLLGEMLQFPHERRPVMEDVATRLAAIADALEGPTIERWVRENDISDREHENKTDRGRLTGARVFASGVIRFDGEPDPSPALERLPPPSLSNAPMQTFYEDDHTDDDPALQTYENDPQPLSPPDEPIPPPPPMSSFEDVTTTRLPDREPPRRISKPPEPPRSSAMLWLGVGVVLLLVGGLFLLVFSSFLMIGLLFLL